MGAQLYTISQERQDELRALADRQREWATQEKPDRIQSPFTHSPLEAAKYLPGAEVFFLAAYALAGPDGDLKLAADQLRAVIGSPPYYEIPGLPDLHLEGAGLSHADLEGVVLMAAHLEGARLDKANLDGANLTGAHLKGAYLAGAYLRRAQLSWAYLEGAFFYNTHLGGPAKEPRHWLFDAEKSATSGP